MSSPAAAAAASAPAGDASSDCDERAFPELFGMPSLRGVASQRAGPFRTVLSLLARRLCCEQDALRKWEERGEKEFFMKQAARAAEQGDE